MPPPRKEAPAVKTYVFHSALLSYSLYLLIGSKSLSRSSYSA